MIQFGFIFFDSFWVISQKFVAFRCQYLFPVYDMLTFTFMSVFVESYRQQILPPNKCNGTCL